MKRFFTWLGESLQRSLAFICAGLFVLAAVLALFFFNLERHMFDAEVYKQALVDQGVYERMPVLMAEVIITSMGNDSCVENPISCGTDTRSDKERSCLESKLGQEAYQAISNNERRPTLAEIERAQSCLASQHMNILGQGSPELQTCYKAVLGQQAFNEIAENTRPPSTNEFQQTIPCLLDFGRPEDNPITNSTGELRACLKLALPQEAFNALSENQRVPEDSEVKKMAPCFAKYGMPDIQSNQAPVLIDSLTAKDWETIISVLLPPEETQKLSEQALTKIFDYFNGQSKTARISLRGFKERLAGEPGVEAIFALMKEQPDCTPDQLNAINTSVFGSNQVVICNPPQETYTLLKPLIQSELSFAARRIPDEVTLLSSPENGNSLSEDDPFTGVVVSRALMQLSPILPLLLLLGVTLLAVRSLRSWLRWWGLPLLLTGLLGSLVALAGSPFFRLFFTAFLADHIPGYLPHSLLVALRGLLGSILYAMLEPMALQALSIAGIGLAMLILAIFIRREPEREVGEAPPNQ
jgi:hypothetical protein